MALIKCPMCQKDISPNATACPHCGEPMKFEDPDPISKIKDPDKENPIYKIIFFVLIFIVAAAIATPFVLDYFKTQSAIDIAKSEVENILVAPGNSEFVEIRVHKIVDDLYNIFLVVDASNALGVKLRRAFIVDITHDIPNIIKQGDVSEVETFWSNVLKLD